MLKQTDKESPNARRLVLGYDGGCFSCSMLAEKIHQRVGDKLVVANLRDPQILGWREKVLGEDAIWGPTLFQISDEEAVRAWTGLRMGLALTRALGIADTWRVMQSIGEMRPTKEKKLPGGFTRGQFVKGLSGAAMAIAVLSSTGKSISLAAAAESEKDQGAGGGGKSSGTEVKEIHGADLVDKARKMAQTQDVLNVVNDSSVDGDWPEHMKTGSIERRCLPNKGPCEVAITTGDKCHLEIVDHGEKFRPQGHCTVVKAGRRPLKNNNSVLIVGYAIESENRLIVYREYEKPVPAIKGNLKIKTKAKVFSLNDQGDKLRLKAISINEKLRAIRHWT